MAMSSDFLDAFARLPSSQQRSVRTLITRFNADSTASGLNYERVQGAQDRKLRSLRIDGSYRAIISKPERGNVHILSWADKHDDAYAWAKRHRCDINPETGAIQVYEPESPDVDDSAAAEVPVRRDELSEDEGSAFCDLRDRQLTRLGVPTAMLAEVRGVRDDAGLDTIQARLPVEAYEALFLYLAGETYEQLVADREAPEQVDTDDFASALDRAESRTRFFIAEDDLALEAMLNAPLEHWRAFLHPTQRRLVERHWNGPVRVLGGAGTGKTVAAMHRARWLARNLPDGRILFTTFARNLATDIENNLRSICSPEEMSRIEVTNLDRWVVRFLRGNRYEFQVEFGRNREAWQQALDLKPSELDLSDSFYEDEWEQVIQAKGVVNEQEYRHVSRVGRGTRLSRGARVRVWPVFEEYRAQLAERGLKEVDDAYRDAARLDESTQAADFLDRDERVLTSDPRFRRQPASGSTRRARRPDGSNRATRRPSRRPLDMPAPRSFPSRSLHGVLPFHVRPRSTTRAQGPPRAPQRRDRGPAPTLAHRSSLARISHQVAKRGRGDAAVTRRTDRKTLKA